MSYTNGLDKPKNYFDIKLYTGTNGTINITGLDFQPDFVWCKNRTVGNRHALFDPVRGVTKRLRTDGTDAEVVDPDTLTSFNSDGFTVGADAGNFGSNKNGDAFTSWNWKAGTSFTNDASSTGIGSIDSTGSVNTDAGFSIVSYTGNGSNGASFSHGLNVKPKIVLIKNRTTAKNWVYWQDTTNNGTSDVRLCLNLTNANFNNFHVTFGTSTITLGDTDDAWNKSGDNLIAYCFAEKQGYSKIGSYTANGSSTDNSFIYTGFKVGWLMIKKISGTSNWTIWDSVRQSNEINKPLWGDLNSAEAAQSTVKLDLLSNGFKIRGNGSNVGSSGGSYIYMAFAENPFVTSTGVPACAR